jgi:vitamin B12 transporter
MPPVEGVYMKRCRASKRPVRIWAGFSLALLLSASSAIADNTAPTGTGEFAIPEVLVTYTREETLKENVAANITVVTREEIEKIPASNLAEVLQFVPGVYVEFNGGLGSQATASIQGSSFAAVPEVAVYQDGVPLNMQANPVANLSFIPISSVERIEVYKGAASPAWGAAMGGVINIITREPDPNKPFSGTVQSSYGDFNTSRNTGSFSGTVDRFGYFVTVNYDESDGFAPLTNYQQDAVYAKFNYAIGDSSRLNFVVNHDEGKNQDPTALLSHYYDFWEYFHQDRTYERLLYETRVSDNIACTIEGRRQEFDIRDTYLFYLKPEEPGYNYTEELYGISSRVSYDIKDRNHFVLGFDGDWGDYAYSLYSHGYNTGDQAVYSNDTLIIGPFSLIGGVRFDDNIDWGTVVCPLGGAVYHLPWYEALIRAQAAKGFAAPPPALLHDPIYGNPDLKPETDINYQLGCEIHPVKLLKLEVNLFEADVDNFIDFDEATLKWQNIEKVKRRGVEARVSTDFPVGPSGNLGFSFGGTFLEVRNEETGEIIKDIPNQIMDISASYSIKRLTQSLTGRYIDNDSSFPETRDKMFVFDYLARLKLPSPGAGVIPSLFFAVHNITNAPYLYREVFPQPGRWIEAGMKCEF